MFHAGKSAVIKISGVAVAFTAESTTTADDKTYQITNALKQVFDRTATITVKDGGSPTVESYTLDRLNGKVTFASAVSRTITFDGSYLPMTTVATANDYTLDTSCDISDASVFGATHKSDVAGLKFASGTLGMLDVEDTYFITALIAALLIVIEFRTESTTLKERVWARLNKDTLKAAISGTQTKTIGFTVNDEFTKQI